MNKLGFKLEALDCLFLACARMPRSGDEDSRKYQAMGFMLFGLLPVFASIYAFVDHWIFDLSSIYKKFWPYHSTNSRSFENGGMGLFIIFIIPSILISYRAFRRMNVYVKNVNVCNWKEIIFEGIIYFASIFSFVIDRNKFGSLISILFFLVLYLGLRFKASKGLVN
ncbi:hypothetical protein [Dyella acidisoli]|uniref:Uncharacterized protein n=1 Tax=Dyella acidisoli TaxID=1867834 RepID=A0ABQ5XQ63_9GAMM|nr:hypothetical protein [Dyella acidisoli]GLQ92638.1 hypothetical protein GCM10007901_15890 [Dyella acidisoli]